ncbi:helix-turn-helix domain-containing protein [Flavobacterium silvaticum]|uniref:Helix-turn-helix domain-containing protein n=1 Tax=Flavobacterium silvaticum TaxID=1852020 RepID=A0A972FU17_9FLAO|nr:helix-turn-helix transcriptional regulator [Flavobacterium silvaticum]NMH28493.1 helix-turn-helix domain-containing protein [Flavobacterium silvaticum]
MKTNTEIRDAFGLTQRDMAAITGVSRSQWAMFETGKMLLPSNVTRLYLAQLKQLEQENSDDIDTMKKSMEPKISDYIKKELDESNHQLYMVKRKIDKMESKLKRLKNLAITGQTLRGQVGKGICVDPAAEVVISIADRRSDRNCFMELVKLEILKEKLEYWVGVLEEKLRILKERMEGVHG